MTRSERVRRELIERYLQAAHPWPAPDSPVDELARAREERANAVRALGLTRLSVRQLEVLVKRVGG